MAPAAARDPEGRKRAVVLGAVEVIAQVGAARTTHRAVAQEAGVPLGSTTYYFPTLHDLVSQAVDEVARQWREELALWADALARDEDLARGLARLVRAFLADRHRARRDYELYLLAARDPALRTVSVAWLDGLDEVLRPRAGARTAAVSALVDGTMLQALVTGAEVDEPALADSFRALLRD